MAKWAFDDNVPRVRPRLRLGKAQDENQTEPPPARPPEGAGEQPAPGVEQQAAAVEQPAPEPAPEPVAEAAPAPAPAPVIEEPPVPAPPPVESRRRSLIRDLIAASEESTAELREAAPAPAPQAPPPAPAPQPEPARADRFAPAVGEATALPVEHAPTVEELQPEPVYAAPAEERAPEFDSAEALIAEAMPAPQYEPEPYAEPAPPPRAAIPAPAPLAAAPAPRAPEPAPRAAAPAPRPPTPAPAPRAAIPAPPPPRAPEPEEEEHGDVRRSQLKRRAAGLGALPLEPGAAAVPDLSVLDELDALESAAELAAELERSLAIAAESNEQLRRDLGQALDDLARSTAENKRLHDRVERLETEARDRSKVVQDLVREMELLEGERDGALTQAADSALEFEALGEKLLLSERRMHELERQLTESHARTKRLEEAAQAHAAQRAALRAELDALRRERDQLLGRTAELEREREELSRSRKALDEVHRALSDARARAQRIRPR